MSQASAPPKFSRRSDSSDTNMLSLVESLEASLHRQRQTLLSTQMAAEFTAVQTSMLADQTWMARTEIWGSDCRKADAKGYFEQQMERYRQLTASTVDRMSAIQERLNALYDRIQASGDSNLMQDAETIRSSYQAKTVQPEVACDGTISTSSSRPLSLVPADHVEYLAKQQAAYQHVKNVQPAGTATSNVHSNSGVIRNRFGRDQQRRSSRLASAVDRQTSSARRRYPPLSALAAYWNWHRTLEMGKRIHPGLPAVVRSTIEAMDPGFALDDMLCLPQVTRCDGADRN